jgi:hypothetical protein
MTNIEIKNKLQTIANQKENTIEKMIAYDALHSNKDCSALFYELQDETGISASLIYELDIDTFFKEHCTQIMDIQDAYQKENEITFLLKGNLKTNLSWLAYEQTMLRMITELELER